MASQDYYLTRSEFEIFESQGDAIADIFSKKTKSIDLIELGAGDGTKTKVLLKKFLEKGLDINYMPIDISGHVIELLTKDIKNDIPELKINGIVGDYFKKLNELNKSGDRQKVILFLGSNIGNFKQNSATEFLNSISGNIHSGDILFIGFDLVKDPNVIRRAYNDSQGFTREFNLNLLDRINEELDGNFDRNQFMHYPIYDISKKQARSYIVSKKDQKVEIKEIGETYHFKAWEAIHTETSQKYSLDDIEYLAKSSGFEHSESLFDCKHFYTDAIWLKP